MEFYAEILSAGAGILLVWPALLATRALWRVFELERRAKEAPEDSSRQRIGVKIAAAIRNDVTSWAIFPFICLFLGLLSHIVASVLKVIVLLKSG